MCKRFARSKFWLLVCGVQTRSLGLISEDLWLFILHVFFKVCFNSFHETCPFYHGLYLPHLPHLSDSRSSFLHRRPRQFFQKCCLKDYNPRPIAHSYINLSIFTVYLIVLVQIHQIIGIAKVLGQGLCTFQFYSVLFIMSIFKSFELDL